MAECFLFEDVPNLYSLSRFHLACEALKRLSPAAFAKHGRQDAFNRKLYEHGGFFQEHLAGMPECEPPALDG